MQPEDRCLDDNAVNAYVDGRVPDDERAHIEAHLATCDQCLAITCALARSELEPVPPRTIGRYRPLELIGQGAMGSVYVAHDPQLERNVALKLVRSERSAQPAMQARLAREARAMAKVRHANVITIHDVGQYADGVFLAMELVDGETLGSWLARKPRSWREIVRVFAAAGHGLEAAHGAGIVHRDFKPDNVLIERTGRVAVGDFGVAAIAEETATSTSRVDGTPVTTTKTGAMIGTPRYMSPEQFHGVHVDARTDQWSFGVALYEALYGAPPFDGTTTASLSRAVIAGQLRPLPRSSVPHRVYRVLVRALATDRDDRFASMTTLLDALAAAARPRGRRLAIAGAAAIVIAGAIAIAGRSSPARELTAPVAPAAAPAPAPATDRRSLVLIAPFDNRTGVAELDDTLDAIAGTVLQGSTRVDPVFGASLRATAARFGLPGPDVEAIAAKYKDDPRPIVVVHGRIERAGAGFAVTLAAGTRFAQTRAAPTPDALAPAVAELAAELAGVLGDRERPSTHVLLATIAAIHAWSDGQLHAVSGDQTGAVDAYKHALELDPEFVEARAALGVTLYNLGNRGAAIVELERAVRGADRLPERARLTMLGDYYDTVGRYGESIMAYQRLLARWPGDTRTQINLVATALDANSWPLALDAARAAMTDHGELEVVRRNLVLAELGNERLADAVRDGRDLIVKTHASAIAVGTLAAALALVGHRADAHATVAQLATDDPDLAAHATADLAAFEGRLDDGIAALAGSTGQSQQVELAWLDLRRGDRAGAVRAAHQAAAEDSMPGLYLAASAAIAAGDLTGVDARVRVWSEAPETDRRMYARVLAGDLAVAQHRWTDAIAAYTAAGLIGDTWILHDHTARAFAGAGQRDRAERELRWCLDHRGQAVLVSNPSLALLPEIYLRLARLRDTAHAPDARAAYQAVVDLAPAAQHDAWTDEAQARITALAR